MRRSEGVAAQEAPAITRKAGLLSDQKEPSQASNGTGKNAGLSSRMRVHFPTMEIRGERSWEASIDYRTGPIPGAHFTVLRVRNLAMGAVESIRRDHRWRLRVRI